MKQIENNKESQRERITMEDLEKKVGLEVKTRKHRRNKKVEKLRRQVSDKTDKETDIARSNKKC